MSAHAKRAPSSAYRWTKCTKSIEWINLHGIEREIPQAAEGTAAHTVLEYEVLTSDLAGRVENCTVARMTDLTNEVTALAEHTDYDLDAMREGAGYVIDMVRVICSQDKGAKIYLEHRVGVPKISSECWGTADLIVWLPNLRCLQIIDFKYGRVEVLPAENEQLLIYLLGAIDMLRLKQFPVYMTVSIVQPKVEEPIKSWDVKPDYLTGTFLPRLKSACTDLDNGTTMFHASEKTCKYCPAIANCPEATELAHRQLGFTDITGPPFEEHLEVIPVLRQWCDAVEDAALAHLKGGGTINGWGTKEGTSRRKWVNEEQVMQFLHKRKRMSMRVIAPRKLLGIPAIEKLIAKQKGIDKADLVPYITKPAGKLKLCKLKATNEITELTTNVENVSS